MTKNKLLKAVIVEDEVLAQQRLQRLLKKHSDLLEISGTAKDGKQAIEVINAVQPDVLFLDIQIPFHTGFEVLQHINCNPLVIFTTAYDAYALKAFEENSVDYLLKPFSEERLALTIEKLQSRKNTGGSMEQLNSILEQLQPRKTLNSLSLTSGKKIFLVNTDEVVYIQSEDKYTFVYLEDGRKFIDNRPLKYFATHLADHFLQVHRSYLINLHQVVEINRDLRSRFVFKLRKYESERIVSGEKYHELIKEKIN
jgi:two-component system LytT family response regulator